MRCQDFAVRTILCYCVHFSHENCYFQQYQYGAVGVWVWVTSSPMHPVVSTEVFLGSLFFFCVCFVIVYSWWKSLSSHSVDLLKPIGVFQIPVFMGSIFKYFNIFNWFYSPAKCICHSCHGFYFNNGHWL